MIILTKPSGQRFALNPDLVQRVEASHETVVTLVDRTEYVVAESLDVVAERMLDYRISLVSGANESAQLQLVAGGYADADEADQRPVTPACSATPRDSLTSS